MHLMGVSSTDSNPYLQSLLSTVSSPHEFHGGRKGLVVVDIVGNVEKKDPRSNAESRDSIWRIVAFWGGEGLVLCWVCFVDIYQVFTYSSASMIYPKTTHVKSGKLIFV